MGDTQIIIFNIKVQFFVNYISIELGKKVFSNETKANDILILKENLFLKTMKSSE